MIQIENLFDVGQDSMVGDYGRFTVDYVACNPHHSRYLEKQATEILTLEKVASVPLNSHLIRENDCYIVGVADSFILTALDSIDLNLIHKATMEPNRVVFVCNPYRMRGDSFYEVLRYEQIDILPQHIIFTEFALSYANEQLKKMRKLYPVAFERVTTGKSAPPENVNRDLYHAWHKVNSTLHNRNHHAKMLPIYRALAAYCEGVEELPGNTHSNFIRSEYYGV